MRRYLGALILGAMTFAPVVMRADDHHDKRYYDSNRKDYHEWNEHEQEAYRHWRQEQHRAYKDWNKVSKKEQNEYFRWRHEHPDQDHH